MDTNSENNNQINSSTPKPLKNLPKVKATSDFEMRLSRRITEEEKIKKRKPIFRTIFYQHRLPVYAYSLLALVTVSFISYYLFLKPNITPPSSEQELFPSPPEQNVPGGKKDKERTVIPGQNQEYLDKNKSVPSGNESKRDQTVTDRPTSPNVQGNLPQKPVGEAVKQEIIYQEQTQKKNIKEEIGTNKLKDGKKSYKSHSESKQTTTIQLNAPAGLQESLIHKSDSTSHKDSSKADTTRAIKKLQQQKNKKIK